jgi:hypothetical protein
MRSLALRAIAYALVMMLAPVIVLVAGYVSYRYSW